MSDRLGRYRLLYPRLWRHPGFVGLKPSARELVLYLLTGPQTNRLGLFYFSVPTAAEDLNVALETIRKGLVDVSTTFGWSFDADARVFYIPSWWRWNIPANANVLKGNLKDLNDIPPCGLVDAFAHNTETLPETLHQTFMEGCVQRLPEQSPTQYQEHFQDQKQKQKPAALRAVPLKEIDPELLSIARETVRKYGRQIPDVETLLDYFHHEGKPRTATAKRKDIIEALKLALSELRTGVA